MNGQTIALALEIDDKGTAVIKNFGGQYEAAMNKVKASSSAAGTAMNKLTSHLGGIGGRVSGVMRSLTSLKTMLLGGLGIYGVARAFKTVIDASNEQEKATAGLMQSLRSMGRYTPEFAQQLLDLASAYQKTTTSGDEATIEGMKLLSIYKGISNEMLPRATKAMLDISALMGGDVASAAMMVGKAASGMTSILRRSGIVIDDNIGKSGDFAKILGEIEKQVGGQAEALRNSGYGGLVALKNASSDVQETLGDVVKQGISPFVEALTNGFFKINDRIQEFAKSKEFEDKIVAMQEAAKKWAVLAIEGFIKVKHGMTELINFIDAHPIITQMGIIGYLIWGKRGIAGALGVGLAGQALKYLQENFERLKMMGEDKVRDFVEFMANPNPTEKPFVFKVDDETVMDGIRDSMAAGAKEGGVKAQDEFDKALLGLAEDIKGIKTGIKKPAEDLGKTIGQNVKLGMDAIEPSDEYKKKMAEITARVNELTLSEYDNAVAMLKAKDEEYEKAGIKIADRQRLWAAEMSEIEKKYGGGYTFEQLEAAFDAMYEKQENYRDASERLNASMVQQSVDNAQLRLESSERYYEAILNSEKASQQQVIFAAEQANSAMSALVEAEKRQKLDALNVELTEKRKAAIEGIDYTQYEASQRELIERQASEKMKGYTLDQLDAVKEYCDKAQSEYDEYWKAITTDIKAGLSDTFKGMLDGESDEIRKTWDEILDRMKKSYSDMVAENLSGMISKMLANEKVEEWLDKLGLGGFARAWQTSKTPPSLQVLDFQYQTQLEQQKVQEAILEKLGGKLETNLSSGSITKLKSVSDIGNQVGDIFGKLFSEGEAAPAEKDFSSLDDAAADMCTSLDDAGNAASTFGDKLKGFFGAGGGFSSIMGAVGGAQGIASTWDEKNYGGSNRWSGAATGAVTGAMGGFGVGLGIQSLGMLMGVAGPWGLALGAVAGLVGGFLGGENAERQAKLVERATEYVEEFNEIIEKSYSSLAKMSEDFDRIIAGKWVYAFAEIYNISGYAKAALWSTTASLRALNNESKGMDASVGSVRRLATSLNTFAAFAPEQAEHINKMLEKTQKLFHEGILEDFEKGILDVDGAIKQLVRSGMSQMDAEIELLGDDWAEFKIDLNGSIETIDYASEAFNGLYAAIDEFNEMILALPDSLEDLKKKLGQISYAMRYLTNMYQSFINLIADSDDIRASWTEMGAAFKEGDLETLSTSFKEMQTYLLDTASAVQQLADAIRYLGNKQLASSLTKLSSALAVISAIFAVGMYISETLIALKDLKENIDDSIDSIENMERKIKRLTIKELVSDVAQLQNEWDDIIKRADFGDIVADMDTLADEFTYAMLEIERLLKSHRISEDEYLELAGKAIKAYTEQIRDYFDEILEGFKDVSKDISKSIREISNEMNGLEPRTAEDINKDIISAGMEMGSIDYLKDPQKWLDKANEIYDLILEKYDVEKARIEEEIRAQEEIKQAYQSVVDTITSSLLEIQTSGLNPQSAQERLTYYEQEAGRLRGLISTETDPSKRAGYQSELVDILGEYLRAAEEVYQRPSNAYQSIYASVVSELEGLRTDAQSKISEADAKIIELQGELKQLQADTITALGTLQGVVGGVTTAIEGVRDNYLAKISLTTVEANTLDTANKVGDACRTLSSLETLFKTRFPVATWWAERGTPSGIGGKDGNVFTPLATGIDYVPYDNFPAMLHKGEAVIPAKENKTVNAPINFTINVSGNSGKSIASELEKEIKWGKLGTVIEQRIRKVA